MKESLCLLLAIAFIYLSIAAHNMSTAQQTAVSIGQHFLSFIVEFLVGTQ